MKIDVDQLFRKRFHAFSVEFIRYAQYMANGGLAFVGIFLMGLLAFYYRSIIAMIPAWFPLPYAMALVIAIVVVRSPLRTFLLEADLLFLTPHEVRLDRYFRKALVYNFAIQSMVVFIVLLLLMPMYTGVVGAQGVQLWVYWGIPLLLKGWNIYSNWTFLRVPDQKKIGFYTLARFVFSYILLAWVLSEGHFLRVGPIPFGVLICAALLIWLHSRMLTYKKKHSLQWYRLLAIESGLRHRFYQFVNNFRDVPAVQHQVKSRSWLITLTKLLPYRQSTAGHHLFTKKFIRSGDFAGIYFRLLLLSSFVVLILPGPYAKIIAGLLFLFMTASQIGSLWRHQQKRNGYSIFPIRDGQLKQAFSWLRMVLLGVHGLVLFLIGIL
ncbi:ABC transporter permease [Brevibacillus sp. M2.1A]|uniref:ABC transporter permease n=1 Tax=Brevibacillus TaxID=55080 RepID=UPI00156B50B4|nr:MULTISPECIES: ABC transporter permease [Brevibacillus]MBY0085977.1 ABC transporter permease [Brevibacillus brevis]MCC8438326.1 ABC transporter permease [Brevibacillus sp. M2.1A]MCE0451632.1 ABC transporter permease [Brevibacillus sp. AF8]